MLIIDQTATDTKIHDVAFRRPNLRRADAGGGLRWNVLAAAALSGDGDRANVMPEKKGGRQMPTPSLSLGRENSVIEWPRCASGDQ